jgi:hypothetical protein
LCRKHETSVRVVCSEPAGLTGVCEEFVRWTAEREQADLAPVDIGLAYETPCGASARMAVRGVSRRRVLILYVGDVADVAGSSARRRSRRRHPGIARARPRPAGGLVSRAPISPARPRSFGGGGNDARVPSYIWAVRAGVLV